MDDSKKVNVDELVEKLDKRFHGHPSLNSQSHASRYTDTAIPKREIPEDSSKASVIARLIEDEMMLDGNPVQNMATFLTSWMEPEVEQLMARNQYKNFADKTIYPRTVDIQDRCIDMLSTLWHASPDEKPVGTACIGSSEAYMLCALAHKFNWRKKMMEKGKPTDKPNIVFGHNAQIVLIKFARYFDVEPRMVPVHESNNFVMDVKEAMKYVDENTICVTGILGSTFTGQYENIKQLNEELDRIHKDKGWDIPIHVDAASGGFVAPFAFPEHEWDFRLPRVKTINTSGHKYGLVYPGLGWAIWRDKKVLPPELVFHLDYLGGMEFHRPFVGDTPTFTLNFSRPSVQIIAQYYNFLRLGRNGYSRIMEACLANANFLSHILLDSGYFIMRSSVHQHNIPCIPVVAFSLKEGIKSKFKFDEYDVMFKVKQESWIVPAYKLPKDEEETVILRCVIRECHSRDLIEILAKAIIHSVEELCINGSKQNKNKMMVQHHPAFNSVC
jgi:glutamate decarboxylase